MVPAAQDHTTGTKQRLDTRPFGRVFAKHKEAELHIKLKGTVKRSSCTTVRLLWQCVLLFASTSRLPLGRISLRNLALGAAEATPKSALTQLSIIRLDDVVLVEERD